MHIQEASTALFGLKKPVFESPNGRTAETVEKCALDFAEGLFAYSGFQITVMRHKTHALADHELFAAFVFRVKH
ncbi:hypothetical protein SDC9_165536 [bioreactor metagenome]|uniref:Uncharacterized protein n=1 Tax=bioreactor metagenome TaxID=1076179 RepID=A0A645FUK1_9ZZZZ